MSTISLVTYPEINSSIQICFDVLACPLSLRKSFSFKSLKTHSHTFILFYSNRLLNFVLRGLLLCRTSSHSVRIWGCRSKYLCLYFVGLLDVPGSLWSQPRVVPLVTTSYSTVLIIAHTVYSVLDMERLEFYVI